MNIDGVNGSAVIKDGRTFWMGNEVTPCPKCAVSPTNVDDCGFFGDPTCPYFGIEGATAEEDSILPEISDHNGGE